MSDASNGGTRLPALSVKPGDGQDACPLCGIHRMNAGFLKESCGEHYLKPECFVQTREEAA